MRHGSARNLRDCVYWVPGLPRHSASKTRVYALKARSPGTTAESEGAIICGPRTWIGRWGLPVIPFSLASPEMRGMARRRGACPGLLQGGPIVTRASPDRRTLALMTRAPAPLGAPPRHRLAFAFHGSRTRRRLSTDGGLPESRPGMWLHRPHPQVPRPAPLRTTPRPKRPSVDGTA
jgi:hypothetical protein